MAVEVSNAKSLEFLRNTLQDCTAAATSTYLSLRHSAVDLVGATADDAAYGGKSFTVAIEAAYGVTGFAPITAAYPAAAASALTVKAVPNVVNAAWTSATFSWGLRLLDGMSTEFSLSHPFEPRCVLQNLAPGASYELTFKAIDGNGVTHTIRDVFTINRETI
jgi:hypothetical protein